MNKKGFVNIVFIILVIVLIGVIGYLVLVKKSIGPSMKEIDKEVSISIATTTSPITTESMPIIKSFSADKALLKSRETIKFNWIVENTESVSLYVLECNTNTYWTIVQGESQATECKPGKVFDAVAYYQSNDEYFFINKGSSDENIIFRLEAKNKNYSVKKDLTITVKAVSPLSNMVDLIIYGFNINPSPPISNQEASVTFNIRNFGDLTVPYNLGIIQFPLGTEVLGKTSTCSSLIKPEEVCKVVYKVIFTQTSNREEIHGSINIGFGYEEGGDVKGGQDPSNNNEAGIIFNVR